MVVMHVQPHEDFCLYIAISVYSSHLLVMAGIHSSHLPIHSFHYNKNPPLTLDLTSTQAEE